jgi:hypothetical protein
MPASKMTVALLEAHRGFQQDQDREEANSAFLGPIAILVQAWMKRQKSLAELW